MKRTLLTAAVLLATVGMAGLATYGEPENQDTGVQKQSGPSDAALKRTRRTVQMLDDIYKSTVVLITDKYVHSDEDFPAGSAAVALFKHVTEKGWHKVRLIDATGEPYSPGNVAQDAFEKSGLEELKKGNAYYDEVVEEDGQHHLRAITPIPVVMEKCIMCHPNYADVKKGAPIGAISYSLVID
jgi:hypothetical protein